MTISEQLRRFARHTLHHAVLSCGFSLQRVKPFERSLLRYMLSTPDFWLVQVGAYNGVTSDPFCKFLIDGLWRGVLIEPQPYYCDVLREIYRDRPEVRCRPVAISAANTRRPLYRIAEDAPDMPYWAPQLASFRREVIASHRDRIPHIEQYIVADEVECLTLATLVAQESLTRVDLLAIDVEGSDFEVLQQIDALPALPKFIYYEHLHLSQSDREASQRFLRERGYRLQGVNAGDTFAELTGRVKA